VVLLLCVALADEHNLLIGTEIFKMGSLTWLASYFQCDLLSFSSPASGFKKLIEHILTEFLLCVRY
jgi:hypothetical protein